MKKWIMVICLCLVSILANAKTLYINHANTIMYTEADRNSNIVKMLVNHSPVKFVNTDEQSGYTLVETSKGVKGYVWTSYLNDKSPTPPQSFIGKTEQQVQQGINQIKLKFAHRDQSANQNNDDEDISVSIEKVKQQLQNIDLFGGKEIATLKEQNLKLQRNFYFALFGLAAAFIIGFLIGFRLSGKSNRKERNLFK